jgi:hypothetical protein
MSWAHVLDPTGDNYLGAGKKWGRIIGDMPFIGSYGLGEFARKDPFGMGEHTIGGKVGHGIGGAGEGAAGGFVTGGFPGAVLGGITGGVRSGLGDSDPTSLWGHGGGAAGNFGIGLGEGSLASFARSLGSGSGGGGESSVAGRPWWSHIPFGGGGSSGGDTNQETEMSDEEMWHHIHQLMSERGNFVG